MFKDDVAATRLAIGVVYQAVRDLYSEIPEIREDAEQFLRSDRFWLEAAGLNVAAVRQMIPGLLEDAEKFRRKKAARRTAKRLETLRREAAMAGC